MRAYLQISGAIFAVVALAHVVRLVMGWTVQVAGLAIPMWLSGVAIVATVTLSVWAFRLVAGTRQ
ncbi:MAG TPA: hypothetical protein VNI58_00100 [Mariprofundaceae bacterium]|nr:hypothetical protein [Mariprofundaceae bacterium]